MIWSKFSNFRLQHISSGSYNIIFTKEHRIESQRLVPPKQLLPFTTAQGLPFDPELPWPALTGLASA